AIAHHYTEANLVEPAIDYWLKAGERAVARSAYVEALGHLTRGLELTRTLRTSPEQNRKELHFLTLIGPVTRSVKGGGTDDTLRAFQVATATQSLTRAQEIA